MWIVEGFFVNYLTAIVQQKWLMCHAIRDAFLIVVLNVDRYFIMDRSNLVQ